MQRRHQGRYRTKRLGTRKKGQEGTGSTNTEAWQHNKRIISSNPSIWARIVRTWQAKERIAARGLEWRSQWLASRSFENLGIFHHGHNGVAKVKSCHNDVACQEGDKQRNSSHSSIVRRGCLWCLAEAWYTDPRRHPISLV